MLETIKQVFDAIHAPFDATQHATRGTNAQYDAFKADLAAIRFMWQCRTYLGWGVDNSTIVRCVEVAYDNAEAEIGRLDRIIGEALALSRMEADLPGMLSEPVEVMALLVALPVRRSCTVSASWPWGAGLLLLRDCSGTPYV